MAYKEIRITTLHKTKVGNVIINPKISTMYPLQYLSLFYEVDWKLFLCQNIHTSATFISPTATLGGTDTTIYSSNKRKKRAWHLAGDY